MPRKRTDSRREIERKYKEDHYKRVPLDVKLEEYRQIKEAAEAEGIGVNTWIKVAIAAKLGAATKEGAREDDGEARPSEDEC